MAQPPQTPRQLLQLQGGMNTLLPPDLIPEGSYAYLQNVRRLLGGRIVARTPLGANLLSGAIANGITSVTRLNDPYSMAGFALIEGTAVGNVYVNTTHVAAGLSGNPVSYLPYRPPASPQPWVYASDPTPTGVTLLNPSYSGYTGPLSGMFKMRSDGVTYKTGVMEPQIALTFTPMPPASGPYQVIYRYTYRSGNAQVTGATGATSNPSPESVPRWAGSSTSIPVAGVSNLSPTQYMNYLPGGGGGGIMNGQWSSEYGGFNQFRTRQLWGPNAYLLSPIQTQNMTDSTFGSAAYPIPDNATVTGIQFQLNWLNVSGGALGTLVNCQLAYNGNLIGIQKTPNAASTDIDPGGTLGAGTLIGGQNDAWNASLSAAVVNDPSFGVNFQILQGQDTGGGNQLFINVVYVVIYWTVPALPILLTASTDPQVDTIDIYRMGGALENFTYVGSTPNTTPTFTDTLTDAVAALNPVLEFDNYEPFPSIDLPRAGVVTVNANGAIVWTSGDTFNTRWLPGTIVLIAGVAYILYNRPSDNHHMLVYTSTTDSDGIITFAYPPTGTAISYQIAEPDLAAEPSPAIWGPTPENAGSFMFGLDPLNPGYLVWSKGNNFDSAPDTNRQEICAPSEALQNGTITSELATVFSTERFWLIFPNFSNAIAAVTGTLGQQWIPIQAAATRGLYMRYAIAALGSSIAWRAKDGIYLSKGGGPEQELSGSIYNLFPHGETEAPQPVQIGDQFVYPPDDTKVSAQTMTFIAGYIFYDYQDTNGNPRTLVYDVAGKGWSVDVTNPVANCHSLPVEVNQILLGCVDGTVRAFDTIGTETGNAIVLTPSLAGGSARTVKRIGAVWLRALLDNVLTWTFWGNRYQLQIVGTLPATIGSSPLEHDYFADFTGASSTDVLDLGMELSWPLGSGTWLKEWEVDWTQLPQQIASWRTGMKSYSLDGWLFTPWIRFAYQSQLPLVLTILTDQLQTISINIPASPIVPTKFFTWLPPNKFRLMEWTVDGGGSPFTVYAGDIEFPIRQWGESGPLHTIRPFSGAGFGVAESST
jgi:hypothetical protein